MSFVLRPRLARQRRLHISQEPPGGATSPRAPLDAANGRVHPGTMQRLAPGLGSAPSSSLPDDPCAAAPGGGLVSGSPHRAGNQWFVYGHSILRRPRRGRPTFHAKWYPRMGRGIHGRRGLSGRLFLEAARAGRPWTCRSDSSVTWTVGSPKGVSCGGGPAGRRCWPRGGSRARTAASRCPP